MRVERNVLLGLVALIVITNTVFCDAEHSGNTVRD